MGGSDTPHIRDQIMFQPGKVLKIKVETSPGEYGFGRATIVERTGNQLLIQVTTRRDTNKLFPKGTKIWFVNDSPRLTFNGMWASSVTGTQLLKGRTLLVCSAPRLEPMSQRRIAQRVSIAIPVTISISVDGKENQEFHTVDLCRSGSSIETSRVDHLGIEVGSEHKAVLHTPEGDVWVTVRILRVEQNWLANKTTLALEFVALSVDASETLDKILVKMGGKPRNEELESGESSHGMSQWAHLVGKERPSSTSLIKPKLKEDGSIDESSTEHDASDNDNLDDFESDVEAAAAIESETE